MTVTHRPLCAFHISHLKLGKVEFRSKEKVNKQLITAFILVGGLSTAIAEAQDSAAGKALVDKNCYACHGTEVYTRQNRMVQNRQSLSTQVQRCELSLGLQWFEDDVENAAEYLNKSFYHFGK